MVVDARARRLFGSLWVMVGWGWSQALPLPFWSWGNAHRNQIRMEPVKILVGRN